MSILSYSFLHSNNSSYSYLGKFWNSHSQSDHLEKAIHLYEKEGLEKARVYLDAHKIHLILVLGVGRHGIALASLIRQAAQTNHEMIDGKAILPLLMGFHDSQSESINYLGRDSKHLPGIQINDANHLALLCSNQKLNKVLLSLCSTLLISLPSQAFMTLMSSDWLALLQKNTQIILAMKSLLEGGKNIPEFAYEVLAHQKRYDLIENLCLQSGLGFPVEMMGQEDPQDPVNLIFSALTISAAKKSALLFSGDLSLHFQNSHSSSSLAGLFYNPNKTCQYGSDVFAAAYFSYVKNLFAPRLGQKLMHYFLEESKKDAEDLEVFASQLQSEAKQKVRELFLNFEVKVLRKEKEELINLFAGAPEVLMTQLKQIDQDKPDRFMEQATGFEDLLGSSKIRDYPKFVSLLESLLASTDQIFEKKLSQIEREMAVLVSSKNFLWGLLTELYQFLYQTKRIPVLKTPQIQTVEGIAALPYAKERWGEWMTILHG